MKCQVRFNIFGICGTINNCSYTALFTVQTSLHIELTILDDLLLRDQDQGGWGVLGIIIYFFNLFLKRFENEKKQRFVFNLRFR